VHNSAVPKINLFKQTKTEKNGRLVKVNFDFIWCEDLKFDI